MWLFWCNPMKSNTTHRRPAIFERIVFSETPKLQLKGREDCKTRRLVVPQILMGRKPTEKANTAADRSCFSKKWKNDIQGEPSIQRVKQKSRKKYFLAWNPNEWLTPLIYALQDFRTSGIHFSTLGTGVSPVVTLYLWGAGRG